MYLHIGQDALLYQKDVIGIFDLDNCSASHITRDFLKRAEKDKSLHAIFEDIPKSVIVTSLAGKQEVYLSQLSTQTLKGRGNALIDSK